MNEQDEPCNLGFQTDAAELEWGGTVSKDLSVSVTDSRRQEEYWKSWIANIRICGHSGCYWRVNVHHVLRKILLSECAYTVIISQYFTSCVVW